MRARRRRSTIGTDIWPGFVDALASLLMVVIFLLMVFALAQHFLSDALSGRDEALAAASVQAAEDAAATAAAHARIKALDKDLETTTRGLDAAKIKAIANADQISSLEDALATAVQKASETLAKLERTEARLASARDAGQAALADAQVQAVRADSAEFKASDLAAELAALQAQAASLSAALADKSAESAERSDALAASAASVASLEATLQALQTSAASLEAALSAKSRESMELAQSLTAATTAAARQEDEIAALQRNVATLQSALQEKSTESAARQAALDAAMAEQARLNQTIRNLEGAIAALEARARQHYQELATAAKAAAVQANDLAALELRIKALSGDLQQSEVSGETAAALAGLRGEEIQALSAALKAANVKLVTLEGVIEQTTQERDALALQSAKQAATLAELKERGAAAKAMAESDNAARARRIRLLEQELAQSLRLVGAGEGRQAALEEQVQALRQDLKDAQRAGAGADAAREALSARLAERGAAHTAAISEYRMRIEALEAQISALNARARALQAAADAAQMGLLQARRVASGIEADKARAVDEQKRIARLNDELQEKVDSLNNALDAALTDAKARGATILQLRGKLNAALVAKVSELKRYRSDFLARLSDVLGDRKDIRVVGDRFVLQSEVLFATAKAELGPKGQASIRAVAQSLAEIVKTIPADVDWVLRVDGHTDQRPIANEQFPSNWELSVARAVAVVRALADAGIPADRLAAAGFGQHHPLDQAGTAEANRRNRRIEFKLTSR